jgi:glycosyltransferase involved in cell wall biosynthesis
MLSQITPVLLTLNEASNVERTLPALTWAKDIVVVDSRSTDGTIEIVKRFPNVRIFSRPFDSHANQWRYAVTETAIATPWILRFDADYQLTPELIEELRALDVDAPVNAYQARFDYAIFGRKLHASLYPPNVVLVRRGHFTVRDRGHTEEWIIDGPIGTLRSPIVHDDRKSVETWLTAQGRYMRLEVDKIEKRSYRVRDWLRRRPPLMPIAMFFYCLFGKGLILNGRAGLFYALQRTIAEAALSLMLIETRIKSSDQQSLPKI